MGRIAGAALGVGVAVLCAGESLAQTTATRSSSFQYDAASGLLTQEVVEPNTPALRLEKDYTYDAFGNKTGVSVSGIDIATRSSTSTYDAKGQFVTQNTNALGQSETFQNDTRFGAPTSHTGPNGLTTTWQYDAFGRKILEVRADGTQTKWTYNICTPSLCGGAADAAYFIAATPYAADGVTQNGPATQVAYDTLDRETYRTTQGFDGRLTVVHTVYDSFGRVASKSRPFFSPGGTPQLTTFTYDALGRVVTQTDPDSSVTTQAFHGLVTSVTNGLTQTVTTTKSSQGQVVSVTDAAGKITSYTYDAFGSTTKVADPVGNVVTSTYDARGRKIASNDPDLGAWSYTYNTLDQLTSQTDAKGAVTTVTYDLLGRTVQRVEPDMTAAWVYDTAANGIGKLTSASITAGADAGYQRSYAYDTVGRPVQAATTISGTTYTFAAAYDANSRLSQLTYPSGFALSYTYTNLGYARQSCRFLRSLRSMISARWPAIFTCAISTTS
jgi:YD repeat-containing protein